MGGYTCNWHTPVRLAARGSTLAGGHLLRVTVVKKCCVEAWEVGECYTVRNKQISYSQYKFLCFYYIVLKLNKLFFTY